MTTNEIDIPDSDRDTLNILDRDIRHTMSELVGGLRLIDLSPLDNATASHLTHIRESSEKLAKLTEHFLYQTDNRTILDAYVAAAKVSVPPPDLSHLKVLIADGNDVVLRQLAPMLAETGADFETTSDGAAVLEYLATGKFNAIVMDADMNSVAGFDVMGAIRALPAPVNTVPMIAISAFVTSPNREAILAAGADEILAKPISNAAELGGAILSAVVTARSVGSIALSRKTANLLDHKRFSELFDTIGEHTRAELMGLIIKDLVGCRDRLGIALSTAEPARIRDECQSLIAIAGTIGAEKLQAAANELVRMIGRNDRAGLLVLGREVTGQTSHLIALLRELQSDWPDA